MGRIQHGSSGSQVKKLEPRPTTTGTTYHRKYATKRRLDSGRY